MDCIVRKASPYRLVAFERRQHIRIEDFSTWIASKEDLIISKLYWAKDSRSEMQLRDVKNLAATGCDAAYIARLVRDRLMSLSGTERFLMGVRMCEAARRMVVASLPSNLPESERKRRLFERFQSQSLPDGMAEKT